MEKWKSMVMSGALLVAPDGLAAQGNPPPVDLPTTPIVKAGTCVRLYLPVVVRGGNTALSIRCQ